MSNDRNKTLQKCRQQATKTLTANHHDEFRSLLATAYEAAGVDVKMREHGRQAKIDRLRAQLEALESEV